MFRVGCSHARPTKVMAWHNRWQSRSSRPANQNPAGSSTTATAAAVEESTASQPASSPVPAPVPDAPEVPAAPTTMTPLGRRRRRRGSASAAPAGISVCQTPNCNRSFRSGGRRGHHRHCCSLCSIGRHNERCDHHWARLQNQERRGRLSVCTVDGCRRVAIAGVTHTHC